MMSRLNDSDVTPSLAPPPPSAETANQAALTSTEGGSLSSQSETSKLTTPSVLRESPEGATGEPRQLTTMRATPPEEAEEGEDKEEELGNTNKLI